LYGGGCSTSVAQRTLIIKIVNCKYAILTILKYKLRIFVMKISLYKHFFFTADVIYC
jgi:hypothetical protein